MTLRNKALIIIISISLLLISLVNASARFILLKSFANLEEEYSKKNIQRAYKAIDNEKKSLLTTARDYAIWDDTYQFAQDLNPEYITSNIAPETFISLGINLFMVTDNAGQVISSQGHDLNTSSELPISEDILRLISGSSIFRDPGLETQSAGFVLIGDQVLLLAYHSILTSRAEGPPRGLLILGRIVDDSFVEHIADTIQLPLGIEAFENSAMRFELETAEPVPGSQPGAALKKLDADNIAGNIVFQDIFEKPALVMRTVMDRDIYNQGHSTVLFFINIVFFGSLFFILSAIILLDRQIISRIMDLSKAVARVRLSGTLVDRVRVTGKDEIARLAEEINNMLHSLESADFELRQARDELEKQVAERTARLVHVNNDLLREIEEREQGQKALQDAYNEIHLIISSISSIMIGVDADGKVVLWNSVAARKLGLESNDVSGKDFFSLPIGWNSKQISVDAAACKVKNQKVRLDDIALETSGEHNRILGITLTPLYLQEGGRSGFLLIGSDITERRLLEEQLDHSSKLEAIGELAAGVAHEINTPVQLVGSNLRFLGEQLRPVLGLIEMVYGLNRAVKNGTATPEMAVINERAVEAAHLEFFRQEAPKAIAQSLEGIDRISHIVAAMRFFSHPGSESKSMANLNQIIENAVTLSRNEWKGVAEVKTELESELPVLECLPVELSQVVLNLIINAVHTIQDACFERPELAGLIVISSRQVDEMLEMRISDNGMGIPKEIRKKIFDPFFTTKDVGRGTGQGLSIVYTVVVKKHGGTLDFESEPGCGTTFILRLPRKADHD